MDFHRSNRAVKVLASRRLTSLAFNTQVEGAVNVYHPLVGEMFDNN